MQVEMKVFEDIESTKRELNDKTRDSEEQQKSLKSVLAVTISAVEDAKKRLEQFEVFCCKSCVICCNFIKKQYFRIFLRKMIHIANLLFLENNWNV